MNDSAQLTDILKLIDPRLAVWLPWVALVSKIGVDWIKSAIVLPKWGVPASCLGIALALTMLLMLAGGIGMTGQLVAQGIIMAMIATIVAIGMSSLQARTMPSKETSAIEAKAVDRIATVAATTQDAMAAKIADEIVAKVRQSMGAS